MFFHYTSTSLLVFITGYYFLNPVFLNKNIFEHKLFYSTVKVKIWIRKSSKSINPCETITRGNSIKKNYLGADMFATIINQTENNTYKKRFFGPVLLKNPPSLSQPRCLIH